MDFFKSRLVEHLDDNSSHCLRGSWGTREVQLLCSSAHQGLCFFVSLPVSKCAGDTTIVSSIAAYKKRGADLFPPIIRMVSLEIRGYCTVSERKTHLFSLVDTPPLWSPEQDSPAANEDNSCVSHLSSAVSGNRNSLSTNLYVFKEIFFLLMEIKIWLWIFCKEAKS